MSDTTPEIQKIQMEIMLAMTEEERFRHGADMIDYTRKIVENSIREENPGISEDNLKAIVFKRYYGSEFPPDELEKIMEFLRKRDNI